MGREIIRAVEQQIDSAIVSSVPVSGGDIAHSYQLQTEAGEKLFLKYHHSPPDKLFIAEAKGLATIAKTRTCATPEVIASNKNYLLLELIETKPPDQQYWQQFGRQLAQLHRIPQPNFGFEKNNYCGLTPQINQIETDGYKFFGEHRLGFQANLAAKHNLINRDERNTIQRIIDNLPQLVPKQSPALIHGDLWSGNHLCRQDREPVLIDPAAHRCWAEAEIAMTKLFGGFPESFYSAYLEVNPLQPGWQQRLPLYNLYHLLNHLNLFGRGYHGQVMAVVKQFS